MLLSADLQQRPQRSQFRRLAQLQVDHANIANEAARRIGRPRWGHGHPLPLGHRQTSVCSYRPWRGAALRRPRGNCPTGRPATAKMPCARLRWAGCRMPASCPSSSTRRSSRRASTSGSDRRRRRISRASKRLSPIATRSAARATRPRPKAAARTAAAVDSGLAETSSSAELSIDQEDRGQQQAANPSTDTASPGATAGRSPPRPARPVVARLLPTRVVATMRAGWLVRKSRPWAHLVAAHRIQHQPRGWPDRSRSPAAEQGAAAIPHSQGEHDGDHGRASGFSLSTSSTSSCPRGGASKTLKPEGAPAAHVAGLGQPLQPS